MDQVKHHGATSSLVFAVVVFVLAIVPAYGEPSTQTSPIRPVPAQDGQVPAAQAEPQPGDLTVRQGPFSIGDQQYTVVLHETVLIENNSPSASEATGTSPQTLRSLEIVDSAGRIDYEGAYSSAQADGSFSSTLTASATLFSGESGNALVIQFVEQPAPLPGSGDVPAKESWQIFGLVNGRLTSFGAVLPLGQGSDITTGGVVTGVMAQGGIVVLPLASAAEEFDVRAWTGNFYALVPVRVDWMHGLWSEAEQCYALAEGTLRERGCSMSVDAQRNSVPGGPETQFVQLFPSPVDSEAQEVEVGADSKVDFLEAMAIVHWRTIDGRAECNFDNVWLRTRIEGKEGWVHGEESFDALGLAQKSPR